MANESLEYIVSTVAVLFDNPAEGQFTLSREDVAQVIRIPTLSYPPDGSVVVQSHRDQVEVALVPGKVDVRDVSGYSDETPAKLSRILHGIWPLLRAGRAKSFGINFVASWESQDPKAWIGNRFLHPGLKGNLGEELSSDTVHLSFTRMAKAITIRFQAVGGSTLLSNFNASEDLMELPSPERVEEDMKSQRNLLVNLFDDLGIARQ